MYVTVALLDLKNERVLDYRSTKVPDYSTKLNE